MSPDERLECERRIRELERQATIQAVRIGRLREQLTAETTARSLAADALRGWQAGANEWRATLNDERGRFVTRDLWEAEMKALRESIIAMRVSDERQVGRSAAYGSTWMVVAAAVGWLLAAFGMYLSFGR